MFKLTINREGRAADILNSDTIYHICVLKCLVYDQICILTDIIPLHFQKKKRHTVTFHTIKHTLHVLYILRYSLQKRGASSFPIPLNISTTALADIGESGQHPTLQAGRRAPEYSMSSDHQE